MNENDALLKNLIQKTREAVEQLTPETIGWFKARMAWMLYSIEQGNAVTE